MSAAGRPRSTSAAGPGALVVALAVILGEENVAGVDPSEPFVEAARAKVPGARLTVAAAEALPFEDGEFDVTLSQLVVNFLSDPEAGVREMARVTRPGGVVAGCVWDYGGGMTMLKTFWDAAAALDAERATPQMEQHTMRFSRAEELGRALAVQSHGRDGLPHRRRGVV